MKKLLAGLIISASMLSTSPANAFGNLWYDQDSEFGNCESFVVLPVEDMSVNKFSPESYITDRLQKSMKKISFTLLGKNFAKSFASEAERAQAVRSATNADFYIVPRIYRNDLQVDTSPELTESVTMKSWMEISGSPEGRHDGKYHEESWTEYHTIPEKEVYMRVMELDFSVYDSEGREVFTYDNKDYTNGQSSRPIFERLTDDFSKTFEKTKNEQKKYLNAKAKNKDKKSKKKSVKIKIEPLNLPENIADDRFLNAAMNFAYRGEAQERLKKYDILDEAEDEAADSVANYMANYKIVGDVRISSYDYTWHQPSITTSTETVNTESFEWRDKDDKKHTETRTYYRTKINENYGHWSASARVSATFRLIDSSGKILVEYSKTETDDKEIDAFHHILKDFYKKAGKALKD